jgi:hypothetical protein
MVIKYMKVFISRFLIFFTLRYVFMSFYISVGGLMAPVTEIQKLRLISDKLCS